MVKKKIATRQANKI